MDQSELYQYGLDCLGRREYCRSELSRKMADRCKDAVLVTQVLDQLEAKSYLSDTRFVEMRVRNRVLNGYGPLRITADLRERGVDDTLIEAELNRIEDWADKARLAYIKRFGDTSNNGINPTITTDKTLLLKHRRYLYQRGFNFDMIKEALLMLGSRIN